MKNSKIQWILCSVISVLCWNNIFGASEKMLTDSTCYNYHIEVAAEPTTLYMDIYNLTDFGPYTPDVVEWYSPDWQLDFGNTPTVVYELSPNFPPSFEMLICADYEIDNAWCTLCEWVLIGDVNSCEYELELDTEGMVVFGSIDNTVHYCPPTDVTWILEGGGGVIGTGSSLFYQFDEVGDYIICAEYSDSILGCEGVLCDTISIEGENTMSCSPDNFEIQHSIYDNWGVFGASYPDIYEVNEGLIAWSVNGNMIEYGSVLDYLFPADSTYVVCMTALNVVNIATGEICPAIQVCTKVEITSYENDCNNFELSPFVNHEEYWGIFELFYSNNYEINEDSIAWYINGQLFESGSAIDYDFPGDGTYSISVVIPDFLNLASGEMCPGLTSSFSITFNNQQNNCEAYFEWQDNGNVNGENTVTFNNASAGNYIGATWDFGDGNTSAYSGGDSFEHVYENVGVYNVCLVVFDNFGCESSYCQIVTVSGTPNGECDYEIGYEAVDNNSFIFTLYSPNNSGGEALWLNIETGEQYGIGDSIFITFNESGVYEVCAVVDHPAGTDLCGFGGLILCETVTVENSECEDTDCVFPGDTDRNMVADNYDILPIGLHFGETGLTRPNATIDWEGQPAPDWGVISADSLDLKHVDTNGDGQIFFDDVDAIEQNYNRTHDGVNAMRVEGAPGLHLQFDFDTIYSAPDTGTLIINADIIMGTADLPVEGIYGVAFSIGYPMDLVDSTTVTADYFTGSWMGEPTTILQLEKNVVSESVVDFGYSRTDQQNISGFGQIGSVSFVMTDNIIGRMASEIELNFPITNVRAIDSFGEEVIVTGSNNAVMVDLGDDTTTAVENPDLSQNIKIFPNPTPNTINMTINDLQAQAVALYNTVGQRVLARQIATSDVQIDVRHLPSGVYLVSVQTEKGIYNEKIIVE